MKFNRRRLILGLYVLALIVITELVTHHLKVPAWPAYVTWVLFFVEHMNPKRAPHILIGAAVGIGLIMLAPLVIGLLAHLIGADWGRLIYILAAVYAIFALGEMIPLVLNSHTFMLFTVAGLALATPHPNPQLWLLMEVAGGALLIGATILAGRLIGVPGAAQAAH
jgi:inner membrane protein involved in colicin E2 resistance